MVRLHRGNGPANDPDRAQDVEVAPSEEPEFAAPVMTAWCDTCGRALVGDEVTTSIDGEPICRTCGDAVEFEVDEGPTRAPWHFKVLLLGTVGYLIYRLIWFIEWLQHH